MRTLRRIALAIVLLVFYITDRRIYQDCVRRESWMLGVVIFPNGDVVFRDRPFWSERELHFPSISIHRAEVRRMASSGSLYCPQQHVVILHMDQNGRTLESAFQAALFAGPAHDVADAINSRRR